MGIPEKNRPLRGRLNIVLTRDAEWSKTLPEEVITAASLDEAIQFLQFSEKYSNMIDSVMVVGGVSLFEEALFHPLCDQYHVTKIDTEFDSDTFLTQKTIKRLQELTPITKSDEIEENGIKYRYKSSN